VRERRVAKDVVSYAFPLLTGASLLLVWATGYPGASPEKLEEALAQEIEGLVAAESHEVERAVAVSETDLVRGLEPVGERADLLSMFNLYFDEPERLNQEVDRLRAVGVEDVRRFTADRLGPDNRAVVTYVPEEKP
jgi:predicted Zn-dependent peptidase